MEVSAVIAKSALLVLQIVGPILATLAAAVIVLLLKKLADKVGVQWSAQMDEQVTRVVNEAVIAAEEWARKQAVKPTGSEKADIALRAVSELLDTPTYKEYGEPALRRLIDGAVMKMRGEQEKPSV